MKKRTTGQKKHHWTDSEDRALLEARSLLDGHFETLERQGYDGASARERFWDAVAGAVMAKRGLSVTGRACDHRMRSIQGRSVINVPATEKGASNGTNGTKPVPHPRPVETEETWAMPVGMLKALSAAIKELTKAGSCMAEVSVQLLKDQAELSQSFAVINHKMDTLMKELGLSTTQEGGKDEQHSYTD